MSFREIFQGVPKKEREENRRLEAEIKRLEGELRRIEFIGSPNEVFSAKEKLRLASDAYNSYKRANKL